MSAELKTNYLGIELKNPLVVGPTPIGWNIDALRTAEKAGASAVVLPSLFQEQIEHEEVELSRAEDAVSDGSAEALSYFPSIGEFKTGADKYVEHVAAVKKALSIPVIGSLNGVTPSGWIRYAKRIEEAGADALELNVYGIPANPELPGEAVDNRTIALVGEVTRSIGIPVAVKLSPFMSSPGYLARQIVNAGAKGLVLFNRFLQPDIDLETLEVTPSADLSTSSDVRMPLRWIGLLRGPVGDASLAATSGVHTASDVIKLLLVGADVTMLASSLLRNGPGHVEKVLELMTAWIDKHEYESVEQLKGSVSHKTVADPSAFERGQYMKALVSFTYDNA